MMKRRATGSSSEAQDLTAEDKHDEKTTTDCPSQPVSDEPMPVWGGALLPLQAQDEATRQQLNGELVEASAKDAIEQTTSEKVDSWLAAQQSICLAGQPMLLDANDGMHQIQQLARNGAAQAGSSRPLGQQRQQEGPGTSTFQRLMSESSAFSQLDCIRSPMFGLGSNMTGSTISSLIRGPAPMPASSTAVHMQLPFDLPMIGVPLIQHVTGGPVQMLTPEMLRDMVDLEEKRRELRARLYALLHARNCQNRRFDPTEQPCPVQRCDAFKVVLDHMSSCTSGKLCKYPTCEATNRLLAHWRVCMDNDCPLCGPVRRGNMDQLQPLLPSSQTPVRRSSDQLRDRSRQAQAEAALDWQRHQQAQAASAARPPIQQPRENRQSRRTPKDTSKTGRKKP